MKGYAISSEVAEAPITEARAVAITKSLRRLEAWWSEELKSCAAWENLPNVEVKWSPDVGAILPDLEFAVVHVVPAFTEPGTENDIAFHTVDEFGRPMCKISWAAVLAEGGSLDGPNGLVSAISHEVDESRIDAPCTEVVPLPGGGDKTTSLEVCDWVQGADYEEDGSPGIFVANAVGPRFFREGEAGRLDIASDLREPTVTSAFQETPGGYHDVISPDSPVTFVFGDEMTEAKRARVTRTGPRGGMRRKA